MPLLSVLDNIRILGTLDPASNRDGFPLTELIRRHNRVEATLRQAVEGLQLPDLVAPFPSSV